MLSFSIILDHSKPAAAQTTKWSVLVLLFDYFAPKAAQMVQMVPCHPDVLKQFWWQFEPFPFRRLSPATAFISEWFRNNRPLETAFHSEWLRYSPKGPRGPIPPQGRRRRPWVPLGPLGPLGSPWVLLGPLGPWGPRRCAPANLKKQVTT